jgi:hypothetical protein
MSAGHIRQRSTGSFELRYRVDGRTKTETFRGTKRDAQRRLRELLTLADHNMHPNDPDRLTTTQWLCRWLDQVRPEIANYTFRGYESAVRVHIAPRLGDILLARLSPADLPGLLHGAGQFAVEGEYTKPDHNRARGSTSPGCRAAFDRRKPDRTAEKTAAEG